MTRPGSSPSTDPRQDDAERVFVAFEKGTPGSTFLVGVFPTEQEANEWASGRPYACDVMDVAVSR